MLPLRLRSRLFTYGFKVKDLGLHQIPLLYWSDIVLVLRFGWRKSRNFFNLFRNYRQNLSIEKEYDLTRVWPRTVYILYYYLMFWWAQYCSVQDDLVKRPDRTLIAEMFMRYIVGIDNLIDQPDGSSFLLKQPVEIQRHPDIWPCIEEMNNCINQLSLSEWETGKIMALINTYNEECLLVTRNAMDRFNSDADKVIKDKENTVGELYGVWAEILSVLYNVPSVLANSSRSIIKNAGMAIQVLDDMTDLPFDYKSDIDNIFFEYLNFEPEEMNRAKEHIGEITWNHLDSAWAKRYLPQTFDKAVALTDYYIEKITPLSLNQEATLELQADIRKMWAHTLGI